MKLGQFEGIMKVYLVKPRGFTFGALDEKIIIDTIGEFDSIEQLNEYLRSSDLSEIRPRRAIALYFEGLAGGTASDRLRAVPSRLQPHRRGDLGRDSQNN